MPEAAVGGAPTPSTCRGSDAIFMGFDFGTLRIGVALANSVTRQARPLATVPAPQAQRWPALAALLDQWQPRHLVVGRPLHADGREVPMTARCERFARQLHGRFALPVALVDERYSSATVQGGADDLAAAVILQQWLDAERAAEAAL
jgi:putative holliday junction resolvase